MSSGISCSTVKARKHFPLANRNIEPKQNKHLVISVSAFWEHVLLWRVEGKKQLEVDQKPEFILVGHLPMGLSFLMHSFLKSRDDNILIAEVIGARKRGNGLVVPCVYHGRSTSFQVAKKLKKQLIKASALYKHMKIEVSGTAIIKKACFE